MQGEDVIKFRLDFAWQAPLPEHVIAQVNGWRSRLRDAALIGKDANRYGGYGFGNVSERLGTGGFVITGTQTGAIRVLDARHYTVVVVADPKQNVVVANGPVKPSSESMTHATLYALNPRIGSIMHVHSPDLWSKKYDLGLPVTSSDVPYGTPAMSEDVERLCVQTDLGIIAMGGHLDGIMAYGPTPDEAGMLLLSRYRQSLAAS